MIERQNSASCFRSLCMPCLSIFKETARHTRWVHASCFDPRLPIQWYNLRCSCSFLWFRPLPAWFSRSHWFHSSFSAAAVDRRFPRIRIIQAIRLWNEVGNPVPSSDKICCVFPLSSPYCYFAHMTNHTPLSNWSIESAQIVCVFNCMYVNYNRLNGNPEHVAWNWRHEVKRNRRFDLPCECLQKYLIRTCLFCISYAALFYSAFLLSWFDSILSYESKGRGRSYI